jgi:hypothetical protein
MRSEQGINSAEQGIQVARFLENRELAAVREEAFQAPTPTKPVMRRAQSWSMNSL